MSELVIIKLGHTLNDGASWGAFIDGALERSGREENANALADLLRALGDHARIAAILPGEQAAMRPFSSPPRSAAKFQSAARLLLEDELAQEVDQCHVATHRVNDEGRAYAVDKNLITRWTNFFSEQGVPLSVLTVDYECLGGTRERPVVFPEKGRIIASFGDRAFAAETPLALSLVKSHIEQNDAERVAVHGGPAKRNAFEGDRYERLGPANDETLLTGAAKRINEGAAVNLLQGAFRPRRRRVIDVARWRRPAMAAGILAGALALAALADGVRTQSMAERYQSEAMRVHQEAFPEAASADLRDHARAVLARGGGASFLALSSTLGRARNDNENVSIDRIRFDESRGQLSFSIRSQADADIEAFRQSLARYGVVASETGGYRRAGAFWVGELTAEL